MTNNKQETAVDILCGKLAMKLGIPQAITFYIDHQEEIREAKEMEKERLEKTWIEALDYGINNLKGLNNLSSKEAFDKWYNKTYGYAKQ